MRLEARVLRHYNGGITESMLARMDYRKYFGFVRELDIMLEEEAQAYNRAGQSGDASMIMNEFPRPQEYEGETIQLI